MMTMIPVYSRSVEAFLSRLYQRRAGGGIHSQYESDLTMVMSKSGSTLLIQQILISQTLLAIGVRWANERL
ncbi:hypothetical protein [Vibrio genomosp. F10]|uniref:hypothetical protein n=1 Tax=Vibrio genomosp. F10 TaxID=723171 RepID=UPI001111C61F|nr:hypothetical protein [Vibrio genomosp. F10]